jgi:hypothetical protein
MQIRVCKRARGTLKRDYSDPDLQQGLGDGRAYSGAPQ